MNTATKYLQIAGSLAGDVALSTGEYINPATNKPHGVFGRAGRVLRVVFDSQRESPEDLRDTRVFAFARPVIEKLAEFAMLEQGWDGRDAASISSPLLEQAADLAVGFAALGFDKLGPHADLRMPSAHPTVKGGIQFEWHRKGIDLEIELLPNGQVHGYIEQPGEHPLEINLTLGTSAIEGVLLTVLAA
jgi:hypothetical protein